MWDRISLARREAIKRGGKYLCLSFRRKHCDAASDFAWWTKGGLFTDAKQR